MEFIMQEPLTLYKLIVLYMLSKVDFALTKAQIADFLLGKEYAPFLSLQQAINELIEAGFVSAKLVRNRTHLSITEEGRETLSYFSGQINHSIKSDIDQYLTENGNTLRNEVSVLADYTRIGSGEYQAHLAAKDKDTSLVELTLTVPTEEIASGICDNWQKKNQDIYQYLISRLF